MSLWSIGFNQNPIGQIKSKDGTVVSRRGFAATSEIQSQQLDKTYAEEGSKKLFQALGLADCFYLRKKKKQKNQDRLASRQTDDAEKSDDYIDES